MKNTTKSRLQDLLIKSGLDAYQFAKLHGLEYTTFSRLINGETEKLRTGTLRSIAEKLNISYEWLAFGKGDMAAKNEKTAKNDPWKDETFNSLKDEVKFYRQVIMQLTGGKPVNFLTALNLTGLNKKRSLGAAA